MCGILCIWLASAPLGANDQVRQAWYQAVEAGRLRGPDSTITHSSGNVLTAFHRLAIRDTTAAGDQPFRYAGARLWCNGEIYNSEVLPAVDGFEPQSGSDCERILPAWEAQGRSVEKLLPLLDGVFAMVLEDQRAGTVTLARDRLGVRPLFYVAHPRIGFAVASTPAPLQSFLDALILGSGGESDSFDLKGSEIEELRPSSILSFSTNSPAASFVKTASPLTLPPISNEISQTWPSSALAPETLRLLRLAVAKRASSDRPVCCLLSGGIDSSAVAALLAERLRGQRLATFSIGFPGSDDLRHARAVAERLGTDHHEVIMEANMALRVLPDVVRATGTYDITTIRASTPMYLLCRHIAENTEYRVVFSGEGSDELNAGYLYFHQAPPGPDGDAAVEVETRRLLTELYEYDVLRADRCMGAHGLELREPFLDRDLIDWTLAHVDGARRRPQAGMEKLWLRQALASTGLLPDNIVWRRKAAFSDAVSLQEVKWYHLIQAHVVDMCKDRGEHAGEGSALATPLEAEAAAYRKWFEEAYPNYPLVRPFWLPRWQTQLLGNEPSATVLTGYQQLNTPPSR